MKQFWLKLNLRTKVIFIFFLFVIIISIIGWTTYKPPENTNTTDNSSFINNITNRNPILSYPVSYSTIWNGSITLLPLNAAQLQYTSSSNSQCAGITNKMDVYFTDKVDSIMIITNKNLLTTVSEIESFNTAKNIIEGSSNFDSNNGELSTFRTYCSYFSLDILSDLNKTFPNTDNSKSVLGLGLRQTSVDKIEDVGLFVYVYAIKGDYLVQISRSLQGSFIFNQSNWDTCRTKALQSEQNKCLKEIYLNDKSMQSKIESEVDSLIKLFALPNE